MELPNEELERLEAVMLSREERSSPAEMNWANEFHVLDNVKHSSSAGVQQGGVNIDGAGGFSGQIVMWCNKVPPEGWLLCDGQSYPAADYPNLFNVIAPLIGTCTIDDFNDEIDITAHGLRVGDQILIESDGTLPDPIDDFGTYGYPVKLYVHTVVSADAIKVSLTDGGSVLSFGDDGTGTHTLRFTPYGVTSYDGTQTKQNGELKFFTPYMVANMPVAFDKNEDYNSLPLGQFDQAPAHNHELSSNGWARITVTNPGGSIGMQGTAADSYTTDRRANATFSATNFASSIGAILDGVTDNHDPNGNPITPYIVVNFIIKT